MLYIEFSKTVLMFLMLEIECSCQECVLSLHKDLPKEHEPLYFVQNRKRLDLLMPHMVGEDGVMTLKDGQELVLACPGKHNKLTKSGKETTLSRCAGGVMLNIKDKKFPTYQLECKDAIRPILQITEEKCGSDDGVEIRIGFQTPNISALHEPPSPSLWDVAVYLWRLIFPVKPARTRQRWINLVTTCHDLKNSGSFYSTHIVYGKTLAGAEMKWTRPQFFKGSQKLFPGFNPNHFYQMQHQRIIFDKLLGSRATRRVMHNNFLSRGHLAPDADFLFGSWQYTTYTYANSAPQWRSINAGNWQNIERNIRNFAIKTKSNLLVISGTFGILRLHGEHSIKKVYLHPEEKRIPVPKYFWKVVQDPKSKACISFVCSNNPYIERVPVKLCTEICSMSGWFLYRNFTKGFTYCCDINDLREKIPFIPQLECVSLLVGSKAFYNYKEFRIQPITDT